MLGITKDRGILRGDMVVWAILFILSMVSVVEVYSASSNMTYATGKYWDPVIQHGGLVCLGLLIAWLMHITNLGIIKLGLFFAYPVSLILLIIVLLAGKDINGAARFIPILNFSFQPSELAKFSLVGVAALILSMGYDKTRQQTDERYFYILIGLTGLTCLLIFTENLSTAVIIAVVMMVMAWIASPPRKIFYGIFFGAILVLSAGYVTLKNIPETTLQKFDNTILERTITWAHRVQKKGTLPPNPKDYPIYDNIQETHARIAIATCGIKGKGAGQSVQRDYLPQAYSDFIYAIIIEEGGIFFAILVMVLYLVLLYRCIRIAQKCKNKYPAYLVMGLSLMLITQAMVNMAVAVGAMPVTGQTLPLVSKGGTSILMCNMAIGIILKVSYGAKRIDTTKKKKEMEEETVEEVVEEVVEEGTAEAVVE